MYVSVIFELIKFITPMQYYHKKMNMVCFDQEDLKQLFETPTRKRLAEIISKSNIPSYVLLRDRKKMEEMIKGLKIINDKEDKEIFSVLYHFTKFYGTTCKICFLLKDGVSLKESTVGSLQELKSILREKDLTDFIIWRNDDFIAFQLKSYQGNTEINEFFNFLKEKLLHYCNDLGTTNLLISMESEGAFEGDFFQELEKRVRSLGLKGTGHVLVSYNEENKYNVINTIYPKLGTTRIKRENKNGN